jgi:hypothetical protein
VASSLEQLGIPECADYVRERGLDGRRFSLLEDSQVGALLEPIAKDNKKIKKVGAYFRGVRSEELANAPKLSALVTTKIDGSKRSCNLNLNEMKLSSFPEMICDIPQLVNVSAVHNRIRFVPSEIGILTRLVNLQQQHMRTLLVLYALLLHEQPHALCFALCRFRLLLQSGAGQTHFLPLAQRVVQPHLQDGSLVFLLRRSPQPVECPGKLGALQARNKPQSYNAPLLALAHRVHEHLQCNSELAAPASHCTHLAHLSPLVQRSHDRVPGPNRRCIPAVH